MRIGCSISPDNKHSCDSLGLCFVRGARLGTARSGSLNRTRTNEQPRVHVGSMQFPGLCRVGTLTDPTAVCTWAHMGPTSEMTVILNAAGHVPRGSLMGPSVSCPRVTSHSLVSVFLFSFSVEPCDVRK